MRLVPANGCRTRVLIVATSLVCVINFPVHNQDATPDDGVRFAVPEESG